jgi:hypothetical protein
MPLDLEATPMAVALDPFSLFLAWLSPDPNVAGERYSTLHRRLVRTFVAWGCADPEGLTDTTLDRSIHKAPSVQGQWQGDPVPYVLAVARYVRREYLRACRRERELLEKLARMAGAPEDPAGRETDVAALEHSLRTLLPAQESRLLLEYYRSPRKSCEHRRALAQAAGLSAAALRKRVERSRRRLAQSVRAGREALPLVEGGAPCIDGSVWP